MSDSKPIFPDPALRWGEPEAERLRAMLDQRSLFYWNGPQTQLLLERFRGLVGLSHVTPCSSGTAALHIALAAAGVGPGDEVITTPITDMGTVTGILYQQGVPVFADLEGDTGNLDPESVERCITRRTKAIVLVHLAGNPGPVGALRKLASRHGLVLIEDCAQAWGARCGGQPVGTIGDIGCWSLNDFKHIGCGDGGLVATRRDDLEEPLRLFSDKGYDRVKRTSAPSILAPNYRITEPQSAVAAAQLERVEGIAAARSKLGDRLGEALSGIPHLTPMRVTPGNVCSYWFYWMRWDEGGSGCRRDDLVARLQEAGLPALAGYIPTPLYRYEVFQRENFFAGRWPVKELGLTEMDYRTVHCPNAEAILTDSIRLPLREEWSPELVDQVAEVFRSVVRLAGSSSGGHHEGHEEHEEGGGR